MPDIIIAISEQMEAKVVDFIRARRDFVLDGGRVWDGEKAVFLKEIRFCFHPNNPAADELEKRLLKE